MNVTASALDVKALSVRLGGTDVLHDLTFSVPKASCLAVIGPNGVGKTVLLKALIGALPCTGEIRWAADTVLGYVPQKLDIERDLPLTAGDFLRAKAALSKASSAEVSRALRAVALDESMLRQPIGSLSGGQFQRLLVAFALLGQPNVLLLDEPAAGVDEPGQAQLQQVIRRLQDTEGMTVLLVSHDLSVVYRHADSVLCLGRRRTCLGPPRTVLSPEMLQELYGAALSYHVHDDT